MSLRSSRYQQLISFRVGRLTFNQRPRPVHASYGDPQDNEGESFASFTEFTSIGIGERDVKLGSV